MLILKRSVIILLVACLPLVLFSGCEAAAGYLLYDLISGGPIFGDDDDEPDDPNVNHNPQITTLQAFPDTIAIGGVVTLTCLAVDEDGDTMTYLWQSSLGEFSDSTENVTQWTAPNDTTGNFQISMTVSDGEGGVALDVLQVQVTL